MRSAASELTSSSRSSDRPLQTFEPNGNGLALCHQVA